MLEQLDDDSFFDQIRATGRPSLVAFTSPSCGHCHAMKPTIEAIASRYAPIMGVYNVDVSRNGVLSSMFVSDGVPTLVLFDRRGEKVGELVGGRPMDSVMDWIDPFLRSA
jgi:thioredoxin-like negative regulator of GroEL